MKCQKKRVIQLHHPHPANSLLVEIMENNFLQRCQCKLQSYSGAYNTSAVTQTTSDIVASVCNESCTYIKEQWMQSLYNRCTLSIGFERCDTSLPMLCICKLSPHQLLSKTEEAWKQLQWVMLAHFVVIQKKNRLHFVSGIGKRVLRQLSVMIFRISLPISFS